MRRFIFTLIASMALAAASAMSFSQAREQAFFLTDKMAYELNLTNDQYNAAYEINLDYILNINVAGDLYGNYWTRRNQEMSYVLTSSQYHTFLATEYFYRPITWTSNKFRFVIYDRYAKNRYYRAAPPGYQTYKGGNRYYDNSPYNGRTFDSKPGGTVPPAGKPGAGPAGSQPRSGNDKGGPAPSGKTQPGVPMTKKQAVNEGKNNLNNSNRRH